jgi:hypothetical protein
VFRESDLRYEADYYDEFFIAPAIMFSDATAKALAASKVFRAVVRSAPRPTKGTSCSTASSRSSTRIPAMLRAPTAVITITYYLTPANAIGSGVAWTHEYRSARRFRESGPEGVARGLNAALSAILAELARDLCARRISRSSHHAADGRRFLRAPSVKPGSRGAAKA